MVRDTTPWSAPGADVTSYLPLCYRWVENSFLAQKKKQGTKKKKEKYTTIAGEFA